MSLLLEQKRVVPWCSMFEWKHVHTLVQSDDYDEKWKALCKIFLWKSRVQKLTVGVECTLYLLQALLRDQEYQENVECNLSENDLTCMYSTAIIRFINLISHLGQVDTRHQPITAIAERVGIPDWLVGIRHEATHANMPTLGILRSGAKLAMDWLEVNYWSVEEEESYELFWPESKRGAVKLLREKKKASNEFNENIINADLQSAVSMLFCLFKEMISQTSFQKINSEALRVYGRSLWQQQLSIYPVSQSSKMQVSLSKIRALVLSEIDRLCSEITSSMGLGGENLVKGKLLVLALLKCSHFPPNSQSFCHSIPLWRQLFDWGTLPFLMEKLAHLIATDEAKRPEALLLITDLSQALIGSRDNVRPGGTSIFKWDRTIQSFDWTNVIKIIMQEPHQYTWNVVEKLCELQMPRISTLKRERLQQLLGLYGGSCLSEDVPKHIYTVDMLYDPLTPESTSKIESHTSSTHYTDTWTKCDEYDWSSVVIGYMPNQATVDEFPSLDVEWIRIEPVVECDSGLSQSRKRARTRKFDWNSLLRKRRRRGGLTKVCPVTMGTTVKKL